MELKKIVNKKIPHSIGIFFAILALLQFLIIIVPDATIIPLIRNAYDKNEAVLDIVILAEIILASQTTLILIFYVFQFTQKIWFKRGVFLFGYIVGITLGIIKLSRGADLPNFLLPLNRLIFSILNIDGALPILLILLPICMGGIFLTIRNIREKVR